LIVVSFIVVGGERAACPIAAASGCQDMVAAHPAGDGFMSTHLDGISRSMGKYYREYRKRAESVCEIEIPRVLGIILQSRMILNGALVTGLTTAVFRAAHQPSVVALFHLLPVGISTVLWVRPGLPPLFPLGFQLFSSSHITLMSTDPGSAKLLVFLAVAVGSAR
jgi:hypothetical protein